MEAEIKTEQPNQLQVLVMQSNLPETKAQFILKEFSGYFNLAAEWEVRAKTLVVTSETQTVDMQMARTGRLFLREKRIAIENSRKTLKEQILREGKAIDGIANVLKALIEPIEEYLDKQEHFVEIRKKENEAKAVAEYNLKLENERIAKEKADAEERERIRLENERLKAEAIERERLAVIERKKQADTLAAERARAEVERKRQEKILSEQREAAAKERAEAEAKRRTIEEKARKEREAVERKAAEEREEHERILEIERAEAAAAKRKQERELAEQKAMAEAERKRQEDIAAVNARAFEAQRQAAEKKAAEKQKSLYSLFEEKMRIERRKVKELRLQAATITCPKCGHKFESIRNNK
jgi:hypothetical protein